MKQGLLLYMILKIAFLRLNLLNLRAGYCESNSNSEAILKLFRFKTAGKYKNMMQINGKYEDILLTYLDKKSWLKRNAKKQHRQTKPRLAP